MLAKGVVGEYYGIQGTTWRFPPILDDPHETIVRDGRKLMVFRDGKRIRLVAWSTPRPSTGSPNTLTQSLTGPQMLGIATSLKRLGGLPTHPPDGSAPDREPIGVIGTGYVGPRDRRGLRGAGLRRLLRRHRRGEDPRPRGGPIPIWEPGLEELIAEHRERLHFSTELEAGARARAAAVRRRRHAADLLGDADLSAVHAVVDAMPASDRHAL